MLPRKAIIAVIVVSFLILGYEGLSDNRMKKAPNLVLGLGLVGAIHAVQSLKELTQMA